MVARDGGGDGEDVPVALHRDAGVVVVVFVGELSSGEIAWGRAFRGLGGSGDE